MLFINILLWNLSIGLVELQKPNYSGMKKNDLFIAGFFPYASGVDNSQTGRGVMPSVKLALDHINENEKILKNYRLHMWWNDTMCNTAVGVKAFFDMMHQGPHKLMLFGAACTHVTDPIAKASKHWHLTQLSYADTHPMFTKESFPNFFRVVPSDNAFNRARLEILKHFNWTRVGTIYQNEPRYSLAHNRLVADLDLFNYDLVESQSFTNEIENPLKKLKNQDVRIILGNFNETWALRIFCFAKKLGIIGNKYQWLIAVGNYREKWWKIPRDKNMNNRGKSGNNQNSQIQRDKNGNNRDYWDNENRINQEDIAMEDEGDEDSSYFVWEDLKCSKLEMEMALEQVVMVDFLPLSTSGDVTISGFTAEEYQEEYDSRRGIEYSRFHGYTYDGIWAVALAIENVVENVKKQQKNIKNNKTTTSVLDFEYRNDFWERLFINALQNTSFEGVTGPVRFYANERKASILVKQFQKGEDRKLGEYHSSNSHLDWGAGGGVPPLFGNGISSPPKDRLLLLIEHTRVDKTVYAILASFASLGILGSCVFLVFNVKYRNQRYIKMSSPQLNNLIIVGCILTYTSVIFLGLDSGLSSVDAFPYICTARAWTLMSGFSLAFGAMFSKTWRVHSIFTDIKLNKKIIKDYQLFMVVGVLLMIDFVILITWQLTDPFYRETKQMDRQIHPSSDDIVIIPENEYCASENMTWFIGSIYIYKGILMIFGAFLAWETRHVSIPALNDSRHVGLSVYNVATCCVCGVAVAFLLVDHQDALYLIISIFVIFCTSATLCLVFLPKIMEMRRNLRTFGNNAGNSNFAGAGNSNTTNMGNSINVTMMTSSSSGSNRRCRATLRPRSKLYDDDEDEKSEMALRCEESRKLNARRKKLLAEKERELQMLIKKLDEVGETQLTMTPSTTPLTSSVSRFLDDVEEKMQVNGEKVAKITEATSLIEIVDEIDVFQAPTLPQIVDSKNAEVMEKFDDLQIVPSDFVKTNSENIIKKQKTVVAKCELWDTKINRKLLINNSSLLYINNNNEDNDDDEGSCSNHHQRSLSEKNQNVNRKTDDFCTNDVAKSTPNVSTCCKKEEAKIRNRQVVGNVVANSNCDFSEAISNSENSEILPIFQKLLNEKKDKKCEKKTNFGRSLPNISIRCDIVEYL